MSLTTIDVIIILFFWFGFKWFFRVLALFTSAKIVKAVKDQAAKALQDKLNGEGKPDA